jgi:hypothetical protein
MQEAKENRGALPLFYNFVKTKHKKMEYLTWFKFSPAQWFMGKIQRCSLEAQAEYIRLCCIYWNKGGNLSTEDAKEEAVVSYQELLKYKIITEEEGYIVISFLDAQLEEVENKHLKRVEAGRKGGKAKASNAKAKPSNAKESYSKTKQVLADKIREEENREDKKRKEQNRIEYPWGGDFIFLWEQWKEYKAKEHSFKYKSAQSEQAAINKLVRLSQGQEESAKKIILQSLENGWKGFFNLDQNNKTQNNGTTELPTSEWLTTS